MICSLYALEFPNGKRYCGMASDPARRFTEHTRRAKAGSKLHVHAAIRKYDSKVKMAVLCVGPRDYIADLEVAAIAAFKLLDRAYGYNAAPGGETSPVAGIGHTKAAREKMSLAQKRRVRTTEELARMKEMAAKAASLRQSPEYRETARQAALQRWARPGEREKMIGRKHSPESIEKSVASRRGKKLSEGTKAKISKALMGRPGRRYVMPESTKEKLRTAAKYRKPPTAAQLAALALGRDRRR